MARDDSAEPNLASESLDFRDRMLARVPRWYSPYGHLAGTVGIGVFALLVCISELRSPSAVELLTVPTAFVFANLVEWIAHKHFMHRRRRFFTVLFDRHTPEHHRVYRKDAMAMKSVRELRLVLIPAMGVLGIVLLATPAALLAAIIVNDNVGWLFLLTSAVYVVGYELTHLCYHLPESTALYRLSLVRFLREHHAEHHAASRMQHFNFNVTVPLFDLVFGTMAPRGETSGGQRPSTKNN